MRMQLHNILHRLFLLAFFLDSSSCNRVMITEGHIEIEKSTTIEPIPDPETFVATIDTADFNQRMLAFSNNINKKLLLSRNPTVF